MDFNLRPLLRNALLHVRPLQTSDSGALFAVASDPLIWERHPDTTRCTREGLGRFFDQAMASGGAFAVSLAETGELIGSSRFHAYDPEAREVEIGWTFLSRRYWGGPYNRELTRLMLTNAFQFVDRVVFLIGTTNWRSQRAVAKLGAVPTERRVEWLGEPSIVYRLRRTAWPQALPS